jgi:hypothetical protein
MTLARWATRAIMVVALVAGIVFMHHVVTAHESAGAHEGATMHEHGPGAVAAGSAHAADEHVVDVHAAHAHGGASHGDLGDAASADARESSGGHGLAHWCAAMIASIGLLVLALLLVRVCLPLRVIPSAVSATWSRLVHPPPQRLAGRTLLMSVCVMRV